jgi:hypothetical protein
MNPTTEVPLRRTSTPYDFEVTIVCGERSLGVYKGTSYQYAVNAYWQAVNTLRFLGASGQVLMSLSTQRNLHGGFSTKIESGKATSLHIASGQCVGWLTESWLKNDIYKKVIATVPGTLGPPPSQAQG